MTFSLPERIDPRHCIVTKQYAVYTPPMHEMIKQVGDWIEQQRPGGYVYGASRLGKTRCVQWYVAKVLEERFNAAVPLVNSAVRLSRIGSLSDGQSNWPRANR